MKCALVTGGSRGIGNAICEKLSQDSDYHILINYFSNKEEAEKTLEKVIANGATGEILKLGIYPKTENLLLSQNTNRPEAFLKV